MYIKDKKDRIRELLLNLMPPLFLILVFALFLGAIYRTADSSLQSQQESLMKALRGGAVRTYALTGSFPESLDEILTDYHITYDHNKFIVEYEPAGSNLMPALFVIPRKNTKEE